MGKLLYLLPAFLDEVPVDHSWLDAAVTDGAGASGPVPLVIAILVVVALIALVLIVRAVKNNSKGGKQ